MPPYQEIPPYVKHAHDDDEIPHDGGDSEEGGRDPDCYLVIVNDSSDTVVNGGSFLIKDGGNECSIAGQVLPGETKRISPYSTLHMGPLQLLKKGNVNVKFHSSSASVQQNGNIDSLTVYSGDTVRIIDDPQNQRLTLAEKKLIDWEHLQHRQKGNVVFQGCFANDMGPGEVDFWKTMADQLGGQRDPYKLKSLFMDTRYDYPRYDWYNVYRPIYPPKQEKGGADILTTTDTYSVHIYYRSHDRSTGGADDEFTTVRYKLEIQDGRLKVASAMVALHDEYYDQLYAYEPYFPESLPYYSSEPHEMIQKLLNRQDINDATFNIVDEETVNFDCPDSEWSSVEVLVFDTNKDTIFRLHQDCLYNDRHYQYKLRPGAATPVFGTTAQLDLVSYFSETLLDIGRPAEWNWEGQYFDTENFPYQDENPMPTASAFLDFLRLRKAKLLTRRYLGQAFRFPQFFLWDDDDGKINDSVVVTDDALL